VIDTLIHGALAAFRTRHPLVSVTIETMPPDIACDRLVRRQAHLLLFHSTTVKALQPHKALRVERVVSEPYVMAFRPGHPVEQGDLSFDHILAFDWAVAGFDKAYQASLPKPLRDMFSHHGFPRYRVLNQSACIELAMRSDMLTLLPSTVAASLVADGRLRSLPFPGDARFAISAVTPVASAPSPTVIDFIAAVRATFAG
jgi:DNA-binding transcriptional LysR family regulator